MDGVSGITSLAGLTAATQTFAIGTSGTAPAWASTTSTHTLNIPMAATTGVTAGLISKAQYDVFNGKQNALGFNPIRDTTLSGVSIAHGGGVGPEIFSSGNGAAAMTFHRPGLYAVNFGLDTNNRLSVGGYSMGGVSREIWHAGNFDPNSKYGNGSNPNFDNINDWWGNFHLDSRAGQMYLNWFAGSQVHIGNGAQNYGAIYANQYFYASDARLKHNIETLESSTEKIQALRGVTFQWNDSGKKEIGFIAQEVEKVAPELVETNILQPDGVQEGEGREVKSVKYGNITALLVEAMKDLWSKVDELKTTSRSHDRRIASLNVETKRLKGAFERLQSALEQSSVKHTSLGTIKVSNSYTIPDSTLSHWRFELISSTAIALPHHAASGNGVYTLTIKVQQDEVGHHSVAWQAPIDDSIMWSTQVPPTMPRAPGSQAIFQFVKFSDDPIWYGSVLWSQ
jgi:hypothetical protein